MKLKKFVAIILVFICSFYIFLPKVYALDNPSITYESHLKDFGWISPVSDGAISGTTGQSRRMEAIKISINGLTNYNISYQVHVKDYGWLNYVSEGQIAGTTGESRRAEAIIINFRSDSYTLKYRVHIENLGWLDWVDNGQIAGTTGQSLRMEAIEIILLQKNTNSSNYIQKGIDVSKYQKTIDWNKVRNDNIEFAMIRCGYRGYTNGSLVEDPYFKSNVINAYNAGVRVGIYFYSSALNEYEANEEAEFVLNKIAQYGFKNKITFPIAFDIENDFISARNYNLTVEQRNNICKSFCNKIRDNGYIPMIYSYNYFLEYRLDMEELVAYDTWLAHYTEKTNYARPYAMWQYTSTGRVNGIDNDVDLNYCYVKY